jgi:hypothetical protein
MSAVSMGAVLMALIPSPRIILKWVLFDQSSYYID